MYGKQANYQYRYREGPKALTLDAEREEGTYHSKTKCRMLAYRKCCQRKPLPYSRASLEHAEHMGKRRLAGGRPTWRATTALTIHKSAAVYTSISLALKLVLEAWVQPG